MKWLILLVLFFLLMAIFATRFRRQIKGAILVWRSLTKSQEARQNEPRQVNRGEDSKDIPLVKCAKCGDWIAKNKSIDFHSGTFYCSTNCLEKSAVTN